jgi:anaerobic selenocysteine-containing dehydrogenase
LRESREPVVVCGTDITDATVAGLAADLAALLRSGDRQAGLLYLMQGANAFGAAALAEDTASVEELLEAVEGGEVKAVVAVEADLLGRYPDLDRVKRCLERLDLLVSVDCLDTDTARSAGVFLPSGTVFETGGAFVNQEGRVQHCNGVFAGGLSVARTGGGGHPPRMFTDKVPGGGLRAPWELVTRLAETGDSPLPLPEITEEGHMAVPPGGEKLFDAARAAGEKAAGSGVTVMTVERTFGTEELSSLSPPLRQVEPAPEGYLFTGTAEALGVADGDELEIAAGRGAVSLRVKTFPSMAPDTLAVPRHRNVNWRRLGPAPVKMAADHIRKATGGQPRPTMGDGTT